MNAPQGLDFFESYSDPKSRDDNAEFPLDGIDLDNVSNEELVSMMDTAPVLFMLNANSVVRISKSLALKGGPRVKPSEARAMKLVSSGTDIRSPRVHRAFDIDELETDVETGLETVIRTRGYIVMDYISGQSLENCWEQLETEKQNLVILQVAAMVKQLQAVSFPTPGPFDEELCRGVVFGDYGNGPFGSPREMTDWINHKLQLCKQFKRISLDTPEFQLDSFVLTHQDISPQNLVLDPSNNVWLIDYGMAGAYPPSFEVAALRLQGHYQDFSKKLIPHLDFDEQDVERWLHVRPFMVAGRFG